MLAGPCLTLSFFSVQFMSPPGMAKGWLFSHSLWYLWSPYLLKTFLLTFSWLCFPFGFSYTVLVFFFSLLGDGAATSVRTHEYINKASRHLILKNVDCIWASVIRIAAQKTAGKCMMKLGKMSVRCSGVNISRRTQRVFENTLKSNAQNILIAILQTYECYICFSSFPHAHFLLGFSCGENHFLNSRYSRLSCASFLIMCVPDPQALLMVWYSSSS